MPIDNPIPPDDPCIAIRHADEPARWPVAAPALVEALCWLAGHELPCDRYPDGLDMGSAAVSIPAVYVRAARAVADRYTGDPAIQRDEAESPGRPESRAVATTRDDWIEEASWRRLSAIGEMQFMDRETWARIYRRNAEPNAMGVRNVHIGSPRSTDAVGIAGLIWRYMNHPAEGPFGRANLRRKQYINPNIGLSAEFQAVVARAAECRAMPAVTATE